MHQYTGAASVSPSSIFSSSQPSEDLAISFEIILVNDGCPVNSWDALRAVAARDSRVKAINLSRNFGQHYAIAAGVHHSCGNWVVVMDCDLQDRPAEIAKLYRKALEGYDIVYALRHESRIQR